MLHSALLLLAFAAGAVAADPEVDKLLRDARSKSSQERLAAYDALAKRGDEGRKLLLPILRAAEARAVEDFLALAKSPAAAAYKKQLRRDIEEARAAALAVIRDEKIYPDDAHGAVGQPMVDDKVARLRELWFDPARGFAAKVEDVNIRLYFIKEATDWLKRIDAVPDRFQNNEEALRELNRSFAGRELMYDKRALDRITEIDEANATAPSIATDEERRFAAILNDYRVMLGLDPLELLDALVMAARKHSQEMHDLGYFAHESPVEGRRHPADRARLEGYSGSVLENCAVSGDPRDAFEGWYRSSGHHRGLITDRARVLGAGQSQSKSGAPGRHWTMLAGVGTGPKAKGGRGDPRAVLIARRGKLRPDDVETRLALARFARKNQLVGEERELLEEVLRLDAEHEDARRLLGHEKREGQWVTLEDRIARDLAQLPDAEASAAGLRELGSPDPKVRQAVVRAVAAAGRAALAPLLERALADKASEVRAEAALAIGPLAGKNAIPALGKALTDSSFYVAHAAAATLWSLGDPRGVPTLFAGLRNADLSHRIDAHRRAKAAFGQDFGYAWDLPDVERAKVVDEWEAWVGSLRGS
jgi:hypothetical protein